MPYYPSIDEDLKRADQILATSRTTIFGSDTFAAVSLLASFVEHIRFLHQQQEAYNKQIDELDNFKRRAIRINDRAAKTIADLTTALEALGKERQKTET